MQCLSPQPQHRPERTLRRNDNMRRIINSIYITLDGIIENPQD